MPASTTFKLRVEITGLCVFLRHQDGKRMGVVMPDARYRNGGNMKHPDGEGAVCHVGYLRFDLANLDTGVTGNSAAAVRKSPNYEVVHRFDREWVDFGIVDDGGSIVNELELPDFDEFAPVKRARNDLMDAVPPMSVLMRAILQGGTVKSIMEVGQWKLSGDLHPQGLSFQHDFGGEVWWTRDVTASGLTLRIKKFDGSGDVLVPLIPRNLPDGTSAIVLKMANLCSDNPMEWPELRLREVREPDVDFKWLYQLLELKPNEDATRYPASALPHPQPILSGNEGSLADCFPATITAAFS